MAPAYRCPDCHKPLGGWEAACPHCGRPLTPVAPAPPAYERHRDSGVRSLLKVGLAIWAVGYPVLACSPMFATGTHTAGAAGVGVLASVLVGATLFPMWIVGLIVLGILVAIIH